MRKLFTLSLLLMLSFAFTTKAQKINLTLQVNMKVQIAKGNFNPSTDVVRCAGAFQGWDPTTAPDMSDSDGDSIYTVTYSVDPNNTYEYKFLIGTNWGQDESHNRSVTVGANDTTLAPVYFNDDATMPTGQVASVTFEVDMSIKAAKGTFDASKDSVFVRGSFNGWGQTLMDDGNNDLVYTVTIDSLPVGEKEYFKFFHTPNVWESDPNREYVVPQGGGTIHDFFDRDSSKPQGFASVTFEVDMSVRAKEKTFDPTQSNVYLRGSFNGWGQTKMDDSDGDSVYVVTVDSLAVGDKEFFKFFYDNPDTWESDPNREYTVPKGGGTFHDYFDRDSIVNITSDGNVLFTVDMSVMDEVGIYDNTQDSLQVRGGFNGWSDGERARSVMSQNPLAPDTWTLNVPFTNQPVNDDLLYKFYVKKADSTDIWIDGWERPTSTGGGNRAVPFKGTTDQDAGKVYYDDIMPGQVIESGKNISITFSIDMSIAMNADSVAVPFNPSTDTLYWIGEQPSFVRTQGWEDTDDMKVLQLTDPDNDGIYTGTLTVKTPTFNSFVYRYGYVSAKDGSFVHEPAGFGNFAYRVRYIKMTGDRQFVQPYTAPVDHWTNRENKKDQWEPNPLLTSVKETGNGTPVKFELQQNYPNPFNPTTVIRFSVPTKTLVKLDVFNILGQKVATLVNKELNSGSYEVKFVGVSLSSGIYLYKLSAGNYTATKKMMLLK